MSRFCRESTMLVSYALNTQLKASKANYEDMDRKDLY